MLSTDEWIKKTHTQGNIAGLLKKKKKEWNNAICSNMDGPRDDHIKQERQIYHLYVDT